MVVCERSRGGTEASPCPSCGGCVPPSLGHKPRKYCSQRCCALARRHKAAAAKNSLPNFCTKCGGEVTYSGRGPRSGLLCKACKAPKPRRPAFSETRNCPMCSKPFLVTSSTKKKQYCSLSCAARNPARIEAVVRRMRASRRVCECLCCGRSYWPKNKSRCSFKFCSRGCAFEARRRKLPAAERPLEIAGKLASWFLGWGDDYYPHVYRCSKCKNETQQRRGAERHEKCHDCRYRESHKSRSCDDCGSAIGRYGKRCAACSQKAQKRSRRAARRRQRQAHGNFSTVRKRCRKYGAPYTPVSRKCVLDRDKWQCQICGVGLLARYARRADGCVHPRSPTIDHIVPLSFGPSSPGHVFDNCQAACWSCNTHRGTQSLDSFVPPQATAIE